VFQGRREAMRRFRIQAGEEGMRLVPDPSDPQTFERCKLDLTERERNRPFYSLFEDLLRLRRTDPVFAAQDKNRLHGATLGERLCNATEDLLQQGYRAVCLINSDSPTLPQSILIRAIELLAIDGDRVVLGAAEDGGYYLIGLKHAHRNLFKGIAWSTSDVLVHTKQRAVEIDLPVEMLPSWYDVDDGDTLHRLCEELFFKPSLNGAYPAAHTRAFLNSIIKTEGLQRICPKLSGRMPI